MNMVPFLAEADQNYAWFGIVPMGVLTAAFIINVASLHTKDMNRKSGLAANLLFIALIVETAAWTVRAFGGGTETGVFWVVISSSLLHLLSGAIALWAMWEHRTIGRWPHGRRRAIWGFWLNVISLFAIAAWFYLGANPRLYKRMFE